MLKNRSLLMIFAFVVLSLGILCSCDQDNKPPEEPKKVPEKVFVIFPNTFSRWVEKDQPALQAEFTKAGLTGTFASSDDTILTEASLVQRAIDEKNDILIIVVTHNTQSFAAIEAAKAAGLIVILYDRGIEGNTSADYYVSFDNDEIGRMQGEFLVSKAAEDEREGPLPLYLYAGHVDDQNSKRFLSGAWSVLQPKIADGTFEIMNSEQATQYKDNVVLTYEQITEIVTEKNTQWSDTVAAGLATDDIDDDTPSGLVYVLAPNDWTSRAIAGVFRDNGNTLVITGQDGETASLQAVLDGNQSMTLLKPIKYIAEALSPVFASLRAGNAPVIADTYNNGTKEIPFVWTVPTLIASREDIEECIGQGLIDGSSLDLGD